MNVLNGLLGLIVVLAIVGGLGALDQRSRDPEGYERDRTQAPWTVNTLTFIGRAIIVIVTLSGINALSS